MLTMEEDPSSAQGGHQKRKKCSLAMRKLLQADLYFLCLLKEASVESATLLFLLLSDNQGTFYLRSCVSGTHHCKEMTDTRP